MILFVKMSIESCVPRKPFDECCLFEDTRSFESIKGLDVDMILEVDKVAKVCRYPCSLRPLLIEETHVQDLLFERDKLALVQPPSKLTLNPTLMISPSIDLLKPNREYLGECIEEAP